MTLTPDEIQFWGNDDHFDALYFHPGYLFLFNPVAAAYVIAWGIYRKYTYGTITYGAKND